MFEFTYMPPAHSIMRHQTAQLQFATAEACLKTQSRTSHDITVGLTTALSLLTPYEFTSSRIDPANIHTVVSRRHHRYRLSNTTCHVWPNIEVPGAVIEIHGIQCLSPEAVFAQLGAYLDLLQLVQCLDALTCRDAMLKRTTIRRTSQFLRSCPPCKGRRRCEQAIGLARENTDSTMETKLRLVLQCHRLPYMRVNYPLTTMAGIRLLDLAIPELRIGIEFDGQHHMNQREHDQERLHDIQSELWTVFVVTNDMMRNEVYLNRFILSVTRTLVRSGMPEGRIMRAPLTIQELGDRRRHR